MESILIKKEHKEIKKNKKRNKKGTKKEQKRKKTRKKRKKKGSKKEFPSIQSTERGIVEGCQNYSSLISLIFAELIHHEAEECEKQSEQLQETDVEKSVKCGSSVQPSLH
jgi:hypothetical protein